MEMKVLSDVTVLVAHFQTPDLLERTVNTFRTAYPDISVIVVDNGSDQRTAELLNQFDSRARPNTSVLRLEQNYFHGPALDRAIREVVDTKYVFALDSDTETRKPGFLEAMIELLEANDRNYGCGRLIRVNRRGFVSDAGPHMVCWIPYMLFKRELYLGLPPFEHHGVPNLRNSIGAEAAELKLLDFPIEDFIHHFGRGTAGRFGYKLGLRGLVDRILNRFSF